MQLAATVDLELVRVFRVLDPERHVVEHLPLEALAHLAGRHELALLAEERRGVRLERHADRGLVDDEARQRLDVLRHAQRVGDLRGGNAGEGDDVARRRLFDLDAVEAEEAEHLADALLAHGAIAVDDRDGLAAAQLAARDAADADRADVARVVELADLQLQRTVRVDLRRRAELDDLPVEDLHVAAAVLGVERRVALDRRGVDHREVELLVRGAEAIEQVEGLVEHPARARFLAVDLVDHDDRAQAVLERLLGHEAGLRHRAVHRIDQQQHGVDHRQHALDLAAEVGVPGRVDDVDAVLAPADRRVLGEDGDAALALEVVRVHDAIGHDLARVERVRLLEQLVDQRGLAVVDVGDDRDLVRVRTWGP